MTLSQRCAVFAVVLVIVTTIACNPSASGDKDKDKGKGMMGPASATAPPTSIDLVTISGSCYAFPQRPTMSITDQNQVYWHSDDTTNGNPYKVVYSTTCASSTQSGTIMVPAAAGSGDSSMLSLSDCSQFPYQLTYTVTAFDGTKCVGTDMGIHITR